MTGDRIPTSILSLRVIPNAEPALLAALATPPGHRSLGLLTTDSDDVGYAALDEATKKAEVRVAYAKSMYAGSSNASTRLAGEFLGILSAPGPAQTTIRWCILPTLSPRRAATCPRWRGCPRARPWPTLSPRPWRPWWGWTPPLSRRRWR